MDEETRATLLRRTGGGGAAEGEGRRVIRNPPSNAILASRDRANITDKLVITIVPSGSCARVSGPLYFFGGSEQAEPDVKPEFEAGPEPHNEVSRKRDLIERDATPS